MPLLGQACDSSLEEVCSMQCLQDPKSSYLCSPGSPLDLTHYSTLLGIETKAHSDGFPKMNFHEKGEKCENRKAK